MPENGHHLSGEVESSQNSLYNLQWGSSGISEGNHDFCDFARKMMTVFGLQDLKSLRYFFLAPGYVYILFADAKTDRANKKNYR